MSRQGAKSAKMKLIGSDFLTHKYFSAFSAISAVSWNICRMEVFKLFFLLVGYRVFSVSSVRSVVKGEKCGVIS